MGAGKTILNGMNKFYSFMTSLGIIVLVVWFIASWMGVDVQGKIEEAVEPGKKYVEAIKASSLQPYSTEPLGEVLEYLHSEPKWKYSESNGKKFVEFSGMYYSEMENYELQLKFELLDNGTFEVSYVAVDGLLLGNMEAVLFLTKTFNDYDNIRQATSQINNS
ncbi:hypothetical protein [Brevibacillus invocatus]|uniref:hypothetical protein n=1 Tax=Brevibacillus invocatus TaxID=173959 RepID=UPI0039A1A4D6